MSARTHYREPYRLSAGMLAMGVHVAFFAMLVVGVRWQSQVPERFSVELWESLPEQQSVAEPVQAEEAPTPPAAQAGTAAAPSKADIELRDKKKAREAQARAKEIRRKRLLEEQRQLEAYAKKRRQEEQARVRAEVQRATAAEMGRYQDMIRSKIRHNIVMPPDVSPSAEVLFKVTLLPDGSVLDAMLLKSSGNAAYDDATERAIYKAQPLPIPTDPVLRKRFRELRLTIRPEEK